MCLLGSDTILILNEAEGFVDYPKHSEMTATGEMKMADDNEKWVNFVWKRFLAAKELRGISIRTLGDHKDKGGIGCSEKTIRRAKEKGKIKAANLEAIAQALDVEPAYLMGKYDEEFGKLFPEPHDEEIEAILEFMLRPERFPYYFSCERNDRYERYLDSILTLHDISRRQYNDLPDEKQRQFMLEIENAVCPIIQKYFTHDARGQEGLPDLYRIVAEIECYDPDEPEIPDSELFYSEQDRFSLRNKEKQR